MMQEEQSVVGVQPSQSSPYEPVSNAVALAQATRRWGEQVPLILAYAGFIGLGLVSSRLGVTWPTMRANFGMQIDAISSLLIAQLIGSVVISASSGRLTAWLNIGVMSAWSCAIIAVALLGAGATSSWGLLVGLNFFTGIGSGMIEASLNTYAATHFSPRAMNWLHACFGVGATLGLAIMTAVVAGSFGWRLGFIVVGILELLLALGFGFTRSYWQTPTSIQTVTQTVSSQTIAASKQGAPLIETLRLPVTWLGILLFVALTGVNSSAGQWFYSLLTEQRGISTALAGTWISLFWASLTVGRVVFGFVVQRVDPKKILRVNMIGVLVGAILFALNLAPWLSFASIVLLGLTIAPLFPLLTSATPQYLGKQHAANGVGLQVAAAGLGGVLVTSLVGVLARAFGLGVIAPSVVISAVLMVLLFELLARHIAEKS